MKNLDTSLSNAKNLDESFSNLIPIPIHNYKKDEDIKVTEAIKTEIKNEVIKDDLAKAEIAKVDTATDELNAKLLLKEEEEAKMKSILLWSSVGVGTILLGFGVYFMFFRKK